MFATEVTEDKIHEVTDSLESLSIDTNKSQKKLYLTLW